jgi:hypothetical protein
MGKNIEAFEKKIKALELEISALETDAGIGDEVAALGQGYFRKQLRPIYFSIQDERKRKNLITMTRRIAAVGIRDENPARIRDAKDDLTQAHLETTKTLWIEPALPAVILITAGNFAFSTVGALVGLAVGFFLGQSILFKDRSRREEKVRLLEDYVKNLDSEQQARLADLREDASSLGDEYHPLIFSQAEMRTGQPDPVKS